MTAAEDARWQRLLRHRLDDFAATNPRRGAEPCSLKLRPPAGAFDAGGAPHAHRLFDAAARPLLGNLAWLVDHSTGPELLVHARGPLPTATLDLRLLHVVLTLLAAWRDGQAAGDAECPTLALLLRGFAPSGGYFERQLAHVVADALPTAEELAARCASAGVRFAARGA